MGENTRDKRHGGKYMGQNTWDKNSLKIEFKLFCTVPWSETCTVPWSETCTLYGLRPLLYLVWDLYCTWSYKLYCTWSETCTVHCLINCTVPGLRHVLYMVWDSVLYPGLINCTLPGPRHVLYLVWDLYCTWSETCTVHGLRLCTLFWSNKLYCTWSETCTVHGLRPGLINCTVLGLRPVLYLV